MSVERGVALSDLTGVPLEGVALHDLSVERVEGIARDSDGRVHDDPMDMRVAGWLGERALIVEEGVTEVSLETLIY